MGMNDDRPCRGCVPPKRHPGCHADCPEDLAWVKEHKECFEAAKAERNKHIEATGFIVDSQLRTAKRLRLNKWK